MARQLINQSLTMVFALLTGALIGCGEIHEKTFESASDIKKQGLDKAGRTFFQVPLVRSASNINFAVDIDTNEIWIAYSYSRLDSPSDLAVACVARPDLPESMVRRRPASWWPVELVKTDSSIPYQTSRVYAFLQCGHNGWLAINSQKSFVAYYRSGS